MKTGEEERLREVGLVRGWGWGVLWGGCTFLPPLFCVCRLVFKEEDRDGYRVVLGLIFLQGVVLWGD